MKRLGSSGSDEARSVTLTDKFWSLYSQDFRCLKFTDNKTSSNLAHNFRRLNPL